MKSFDWSRDFKTKSECAVTLCGQLPYETFGPFNRVGVVSEPIENLSGRVDGCVEHLTRWHESGANMDKREWSLVNVPREFTFTVFLLSNEGNGGVYEHIFSGTFVSFPSPCSIAEGFRIIARRTFTIKEGDFLTDGKSGPEVNGAPDYKMGIPGRDF